MRPFRYDIIHNHSWTQRVVGLIHRHQFIILSNLPQSHPQVYQFLHRFYLPICRRIVNEMPNERYSNVTSLHKSSMHACHVPTSTLVHIPIPTNDKVVANIRKIEITSHVKILEDPRLGRTLYRTETSIWCRVRYNNERSRVLKRLCVSRRLACPVFFGVNAVTTMQRCVRIWFRFCNTLKKYCTL